MSAGDHPAEASFVRVINSLIFLLIIGTVAICVHVISQSNINGKLTWIVIGKIPKTILAELDGIDERGLAQIDFDPAIGTVTDPTGAASIETIIEIGGLMNSIVTGDRILGYRGTSHAVPLKCEIATFIKSFRETHGWQITRFTDRFCQLEC